MNYITVMLKYLVRHSQWPSNVFYTGCSSNNWVKFRRSYGKRRNL